MRRNMWRVLCVLMVGLCGPLVAAEAQQGKGEAISGMWS